VSAIIADRAWRHADTARAGVASYGTSAAIRLLFFGLYYVVNVIFAADAFSVFITFPIFLVCILNVASIRQDYATPTDLVWMVLYFFFVIAPVQSLKAGYLDSDSPAAGIFFSEVELITAATIVLVFVVAATATTLVVRRLVPQTVVRLYTLNDRALPALMAIVVFAFAGFVYFNGGIENVLADRYSKANLDGSAGAASASLIALTVLLVACLFICVHATDKPHRSIWHRWRANLSCAVALALLLICQNPFNTPRFYLMIAWLPIILVFLSGRLGVKTFYLGALVGVFVLMPALNLTTRYGTSLIDAATHLDLSQFLLKTPGLDVFDTLLFEVRYLQSADFYWGQKTLGLIFFFVPRAIWTSKATLLTGELGSRLYDLGSAGTGNLSLFVAGDFYADLGLLGVALGATAISALLTVFGLRRLILVHGLDLRLFVFMASTPILIRGALGAVLPLTFLELIILAVLTRVLCRERRPMLAKAPWPALARQANAIAT
jgi:hypothetical protein